MKESIWGGIVNRDGWPPGPWDDEPDKVEWRYETLPCLMVRTGIMGHWCGYVGVWPEHLLWGCQTSQLDVEVHGGLTYAGRGPAAGLESFCVGNGRYRQATLCHTPGPREGHAAWWFGFDCNHGGVDVSPHEVMISGVRLAGNDMRVADRSGRRATCTYRDIVFVRREVAELAKQIVEHKCP